MLLATPWLPCLLIIFIVLRFDGSVRRPRDPTAGFSTDHLASRAACSAVLLDDQQRILALGGTRLDKDARSVEAEYEGLLLGLEELVRLCDAGSLTPLVDDRVLLIQGDC